jgi:hypothetical protein
LYYMIQNRLVHSSNCWASWAWLDPCEEGRGLRSETRYCYPPRPRWPALDGRPTSRWYEPEAPSFECILLVKGWGVHGRTGNRYWSIKLEEAWGIADLR